MIQASSYGRLVADPVERQTRNGKAMVTARLAVDAARHGEPSITLWVSVLAFGKVGEQLTRHTSGDMVSVSGPMHLSKYTGRDGIEREQWTLVADSLVSARTVRPGGRRASVGNGRQPPGDASPPFNDGLEGL